MQKTTEYRLAWTHRITPYPGLVTDVVTGWVGSPDPAAIIRFAQSETWGDDTVMTTSIISPSGGILRQARSLPAAVISWNPLDAELPAHDPKLMLPIAIDQKRLSFFAAIRRATDAAVEDGILSGSAAVTILLGVRDLTESTKVAPEPPKPVR